MSNRPRNLIIGRSIEEAAGPNAGQSFTRQQQESAYEAVYRALRARWLTIDWDTHSLLVELQDSLRISFDQCKHIWSMLKSEEDAWNNAQGHVALVQNDLGNPQQRHLFTERELQDMNVEAYEAVELVFRIQRVDPRQAMDTQTALLLEQLRVILEIPEEIYTHVLERLERRVKVRPLKRRDNAQTVEPYEPNPAPASRKANEGEPPRREPKLRSLMVLTYGSKEEWERRKLELLQPAHRSCSQDEEHKYEPTGDDDDDDNDDDEENSQDMSDEDWKEEGKQ